MECDVYFDACCLQLDFFTEYVSHVLISPNSTMVNAAFTTVPEGAFSHLQLLQFL